MDELCLVFPTAGHKAAVADYIAEHARAGENHLNGTCGLHHYGDDYEAWLAHRMLERDGKGLRPGGDVPGITYLAAGRADGGIVGMITIRPVMNARITDFDGNIGAGVRPSRRRQGCASAMVALALEECRRLGLGRVLITCDDDNLASERTIIKAGGVPEDRRQEPHGNWVKRFWIEL